MQTGNQWLRQNAHRLSVFGGFEKGPPPSTPPWLKHVFQLANYAHLLITGVMK